MNIHLQLELILAPFCLAPNYEFYDWIFYAEFKAELNSAVNFLYLLFHSGICVSTQREVDIE